MAFAFQRHASSSTAYSRLGRSRLARPLAVAVLSLAILLIAHAASAASLFFTDAGGPFTWDNGIAAADWSTTTGGTYNNLWVTGSDAHFEGTAGTVNVSGTIASVNSITFAVDGYTLSGGAITMTGANITTGAGTDTIASALMGTAGLTKAGAGTLILTGNDSYTGTTTISTDHSW